MPLLSSSKPKSLLALASQKILLAHSNTEAAMKRWHELRATSARSLGYDISLFAMADHFPFIVFPRLDRLWRKRDPALMRLYEALGRAIDAHDVFIHYNGALIHPEFLQQFKKLTIYHCADDPDASAVLSRPVASSYDICAISNPACIDMYRSWGCQSTFFWPLGAYVSYLDGADMDSADEVANGLSFTDRKVPLVFMGSKLGVPSIRLIGKYLGLFKKKRFMTRLEREFPDMLAYGEGWSRGWMDPTMIPQMYRQSRLGLNVHNSLGPINFRLYDLAAFGVCQVCDNKDTLDLVFDQGSEIVGFKTVGECIDLIRYYLAHPIEAQQIGGAARARFQRDYTMKAIWTGFFAEVEKVRGRHA